MRKVYPFYCLLYFLDIIYYNTQFWKSDCKQRAKYTDYQRAIKGFFLYI